MQTMLGKLGCGHWRREGEEDGEGEEEEEGEGGDLGNTMATAFMTATMDIL